MGAHDGSGFGPAAQHRLGSVVGVQYRERTGAGSEAISGLGRALFSARARALLVSNWRVETTKRKDRLNAQSSFEISVTRLTP
jgi:hypothetical protein